MSNPHWLSAIRRYLLTSLLGHAAWEVLQLPLFTLWHEEPPRQIALATLHCLGGDLAIATSVLIGALVLAGRPGWPGEGARMVAGWAWAFGLAYTAWSEYSNAIVRRTWVYTDDMPLIPGLGIGVTPMLQWVVIPALALFAASRSSVHRPR